MALKDIELELNLLKSQLGEHGGNVDEIANGVRNLSKEHLSEYADSFQTGVPYIREGIDAIAAARDGDPFAISVASLSIFSGFLTMAGPMTGPVGPLIGALTSLLSTILGQFLPASPNIKDEVKEVFDKFLADQKKGDLGAAADQIWVFVDTIERGASGKPERRPWEPLNLQHGPEIKAIDDAWQWLADSDKQSLPQWGIVLEKTCRVFTQLLEAVTVSVAYPSTRDGAKPGEMLLHVPSRMRLFLKYLRAIKPVAQQRGTFWHLGSNSLYSYDESGDVYTCDSIVAAKANWQRLYGTSRAMTVTLNQGQHGRSRPVVTLLTLEPPTDALPGKNLTPGATGDLGYDTNHPFKPNNKTYGISGEWPPPSTPWPQLKGNEPSRPLEGCYDIFALPADKRFPGGTFFYTANGNEIRGYIRDEDGKVFFAWSHSVTGRRKVGSIRVVSNLRGFRFDPDENPKEVPVVLKDIDWMIYAGCEVPSGGMDILIRFFHKKDGPGEGYVRAPWPNFRGITVDRGYLWVYRAGDIACATHTAVRKALKENRAPSWMTCSIPKGVVERLSLDENRLNGLLDLTACDDGTLFAAFIQRNWNNSQNHYQLFMLTPNIDLQKRTLVLQAADFVPIPGEGFRVGKLPLFCWSLLEETTSTLEEQTAIPLPKLTTRLADVVAKLEKGTAAPAS